MNGEAGESKDGVDEHQTSQILHALEVVYDARSSNKLRFDATQYLEKVRSDNGAPGVGFGLASSQEQPPVVRYFGLSLIEHAIRFRWQDLLMNDSSAVRQWVLRLAHGSTIQDPPFVTNKIAEVWVELAKRSWALDWMNMDELLVQLWEGTMPQRVFVLTVLTMLSEEVFGLDDTTVALRGSDLNRACVDIFTPADVLAQHFPNRETSVNIRHGPGGWVARFAEALSSCVGEIKATDGQRAVILKMLSTYRSVVSWIIPDALVTTNSLAPVFECLEVNDVSIQLVSSVFDWLMLGFSGLITLRRQWKHCTRFTIGANFRPAIFKALLGLCSSQILCSCYVSCITGWGSIQPT